MTLTASPPTRARIRGVLAPVLTPFKQDLEVDTAAFIRHSRWLVDNGVGLAVFGTNSEAASLGLSERISLLEALIEAGLPAAKMMPGIGTCSFRETAELTRHAIDAGVSGVLMLPPYYFKDLTENGLFDYYSRIVDAVSDSRLQIYLYHIPQVTKVPITLGLIERLLTRYPDVFAGAKDSSGDWSNTEAMIRTFSSDGFDVFPASEALMARAIAIGGAGCISATANVNPRGLSQFYSALKTDQPVTTSALALALSVREIFTSAPMIPAMKYVISKFSESAAWTIVRPPLTSLPEDAGATLMKRLDAAGFHMDGLNR